MSEHTSHHQKALDKKARVEQAKNARLADMWTGMGTRFLPFADAVSTKLPLGKLLRLSLFQISVGMAIVLLTGTINRVMIVDLLVPASLVALMISLPLVFAPLRILIGHNSDNHKSALGWRRSPYIWFGSLLQFGGLAIMPFALLILSGDTTGPAWIGTISAALAFLLVGAGLHTTQTAGLALATDIASEETRPRVVAMLYVMLLIGMGLSAIIFGTLLTDFTQLKLIKVIQGAAVVTMVLNLIALWKQENRQPNHMQSEDTKINFRESWAQLIKQPQAKRQLWTVALGTAAFSMQDVLLEPYGGEILSLSVSQTTFLTALFALGSLAGFALSGRQMLRGGQPHRLAGLGIVVGVFAFSGIIFSDPLRSPLLFYVGTSLIGFGGGIFSVCTLTAIMALAKKTDSGIAIGAWGAVQATAAGIAIIVGGVLRDIVGTLATSGKLGPALTMPSTGYSAVYHLEIFLLFITLVALGPLARFTSLPTTPGNATKIGLAAFPS